MGGRDSSGTDKNWIVPLLENVTRRLVKIIFAENAYRCALTNCKVSGLVERLRLFADSGLKERKQCNYDPNPVHIHCIIRRYFFNKKINLGL
jgi:hypothetical protein